MFYHVGQAKYITIFSELFWFWILSKFLFTLLWNLMLTFVHFKFIFHTYLTLSKQIAVYFWHTRHRSHTIHMLSNVINFDYYDHSLYILISFISLWEAIKVSSFGRAKALRFSTEDIQMKIIYCKYIFLNLYCFRHFPLITFRESL